MLHVAVVPVAGEVNEHSPMPPVNVYPKLVSVQERPENGDVEHDALTPPHSPLTTLLLPLLCIVTVIWSPGTHVITHDVFDASIEQSGVRTCAVTGATANRPEAVTRPSVTSAVHPAWFMMSGGVS